MWNIKGQLMAQRDYPIYNKKYRWYINPSQLFAIDSRSVYLFTLNRGVKPNKLGSWTFYSHLLLNLDVLDTLRHEFSGQKYEKI